VSRERTLDRAVGFCRMRRRIASTCATLALCVALSGAFAQQPTASPASDPALQAASGLIGRALILRCFCAQDSLSFDTTGQLRSPSKATDWTLAGFHLQKVTQRDPATLELDGVRVAIRFAPDRGEFDRHDLKDEHVKILVDLPASGAAPGASVDHTLGEIFSEGLDLRLQRAMPPYWLHYFLPQTPWADSLGSTPVVPGGAPGIVQPRVVKRSEPGYTAAAQHDRVQGAVQIRLVVNITGEPERIAIAQPLGYGLDAEAVTALAKYRFEPAANAQGQPVDAQIQVRQEFVLVPHP
jgi:TonB family protein